MYLNTLRFVKNTLRHFKKQQTYAWLLDILTLPPSCVMLFPRIDPSLIQLAFFFCPFFLPVWLAMTVQASKQRADFSMFSRSLVRVEARRARGAAEVEGSVFQSSLKICMTAGIRETAAEQTRAVLPDRRRAAWCRLLIAEGVENIQNMVVKDCQWTCFWWICLETLLRMQTVCISAHLPSQPLPVRFQPS